MIQITQDRKPFVCKQLASLVATGATRAQMMQETRLSESQLRTLLLDPITQQHVAELGDEVLKVAVREIRKRVASLSGKALKALEKNLDSGNMEAVRTAFRVLGVEQPEQTQAPDNTINVILPGSSGIEKAIDAEGQRIYIDANDGAFVGASD